MAVRKAAVVGAGIMGAGIAAQMANAGIAVTLLDLPSDGEDRSAIARTALQRLASARPPALAAPDCSALITPGNFDDDLGRLSDVDWVVEAVVENLAVKRDILARVAAAAPSAVLSSNTSTLSLASLVDGLPSSVADRLMVTHFFNPPRQMKLVEVVATSTRPELLAQVLDAADRQLGKTVIRCADSPGFIANRLGTYWMCLAVAEALDRGIGVVEADAVLSGPFSIPPTGVFGLLDLIGLDTIEKGVISLLRMLDATDPLIDPGQQSAGLFRDMVANGLLGRKSKAGFFRGTAPRENLDLATRAYGEITVAPDLAGGGRDPVSIIGDEGPLGRYAWAVMSATFAYSCRMVSELGATPAEIDQAMTLGYAWRKGPFQLMDAIGLDRLRERWRADGCEPPPLLDQVDSFYRFAERSVAIGGGRRVGIESPPGVVLVSELRRTGRPIIANRSASLWDIGDGIALFELHSKMNTLDDEVLNLLSASLAVVRGSFHGMVIGGDAPNFSAGANLAKTVQWIKSGEWSALEDTLAAGQRAMLALKYAPFPVVAALSGVALGGGCEIVLHCDAVQAHLECTIGLVERNVGIVPGWGGVAQMLARLIAAKGDQIAGAVAAFNVIATAATGTSAHLARKQLFLRPNDGLTMNRDRLLGDAKALALSLLPGYQPPAAPRFALGSPDLRNALADARLSMASDPTAAPYDAVIAEKLAWVLGGGDAEAGLQDEAALHTLERTALLSLARDARTVARMEHMLATGKPLRN